MELYDNKVIFNPKYQYNIKTINFKQLSVWLYKLLKNVQHKYNKKLELIIIKFRNA
jgi:hypothetical protein